MGFELRDFVLFSQPFFSPSPLPTHPQSGSFRMNVSHPDRIHLDIQHSKHALLHTVCEYLPKTQPNPSIESVFVQLRFRPTSDAVCGGGGGPRKKDIVPTFLRGVHGGGG